MKLDLRRIRIFGALRAPLPRLLDTLGRDNCCCSPGPLSLSRPVGASSPRACACSRPVVVSIVC
eukprot:5532075-Pleurochrysis_carterae.AAC.1